MILIGKTNPQSLRTSQTSEATSLPCKEIATPLKYSGLAMTTFFRHSRENGNPYILDSLLYKLSTLPLVTSFFITKSNSVWSCVFIL